MEGGPGGPGRWSVYLADLPGYGYARGGAPSVAELARVAESYFGAGFSPAQRDTPVGQGFGPDHKDRPVGQGFSPDKYRIAGVLQIVDARHPGLEADVEAGTWLASLGIDRAIAANKIDKLSRRERDANLGTLERTLGMAARPVSAASGEGLDALWTLIARWARR